MLGKPRILLIDALRGIAIAGILLLHHIEHFDFYLKPDYELDWLVKTDKWVWNNLFKLVSGKAFALFSLLFGVSFWIIHENCASRGEKYFLRHLWRMLLLAIIGCFHVVFFRGDILIMYAFLGTLVLVSKYMNNRLLITVSIVLLVNPLYFFNLFAYFLDWELYDFRVPFPKANIRDILSTGSFGEVLQMNFTSGFKSTLIWSWNVGRFFTILGLFYLGVVLARTKLLVSTDLKFWYRLLAASIFVIYTFNWADTVWLKIIGDKEALRLLRPMVDSYSKLSYMFMMLSLIVILWRHNDGKVWVKKFTDFGRMGLTNYVLMSIIGSLLYYGWGLGLYKYCGSLYSILIGILCLLIQMLFSSWWLKKHDQGPLESIWRKMTWLKIK
ncbi:DUF418 domain-containing protein [Reichenbachiella versicolor]|uniref:DUF418 domain-containing protein n=1 Tax=Reichenbachiella versicolor TaxID=1821036 RepID=UPI000D6DF5E2|nr:DUF418 domain-containing protein [Reichenbachiella versicolor]